MRSANFGSAWPIWSITYAAAPDRFLAKRRQTSRRRGRWARRRSGETRSAPQHGGWLDQRTREPRSLVYYEASLFREARELMDALGMTPRARAALGLDLARTQQFDLARHWQEDADG